MLDDLDESYRLFMIRNFPYAHIVMLIIGVALVIKGAHIVSSGGNWIQYNLTCICGVFFLSQSLSFLISD